MKALIFGVTGQDGRYLTELLTREGVTVVGVSRHGRDLCLDVSDATSVRRLIREVQPNFIFHLAATSSIKDEHLWDNHASISGGTLAILDAVRHECPSAKVLLAGSALQFVNEGEPLNEESPLDHSNHYVVARNHSLFAARYFRHRGLNVYFAFFFHHDSPFRSNRHLSMRIAEAAARAAAGNGEKLCLGDLSAQKEFNFAGDAVAAMWCLVNQDAIFECVVGSGRANPIRNWVSLCFGYFGLDWTRHVDEDEVFQSSYQRIVSDPSKLLSLGWRPRVGIEKLCEMMVREATCRVNAQDGNCSASSIKTENCEELRSRILESSYG